MSSMLGLYRRYTSLEVHSIKRWTGALTRPKGMTFNWYRPPCTKNTVFAQADSVDLPVAAISVQDYKKNLTFQGCHPFRARISYVFLVTALR